MGCLVVCLRKSIIEVNETTANSKMTGTVENSGMVGEGVGLAKADVSGIVNVCVWLQPLDS